MATGALVYNRTSVYTIRQLINEFEFYYRQDKNAISETKQIFQNGTLIYDVTKLKCHTVRRLQIFNLLYDLVKCAL